MYEEASLKRKKKIFQKRMFSQTSFASYKN